MTKVKELNLDFNTFCFKHLDGLYEPRLGLESQSTGYLLLRKMVLENIQPSTEEEYQRWRLYPTFEELLEKPPLKHLLFLHELLRPIVREHWNEIKNLEIK